MRVFVLEDAFSGAVVLVDACVNTMFFITLVGTVFGGVGKAETDSI